MAQFDNVLYAESLSLNNSIALFAYFFVVSQSNWCNNLPDIVEYIFDNSNLTCSFFGSKSYALFTKKEPYQTH